MTRVGDTQGPAWFRPVKNGDPGQLLPDAGEHLRPQSDAVRIDHPPKPEATLGDLVVTARAAQADAQAAALPPALRQAIDAYLSALRSPADRHYKSLADRLANDPRLRPAASALYAGMDRAIREHRVDQAVLSQDTVLANAPFEGADRAEFQLAFAHQHAQAAYEASNKPQFGTNDALDPVWRNEYKQASPSTDLKSALQSQKHDFAQQLALLQSRGYQSIRMTLNPANMPSPAIAQAYDLWKKGGAFPHGTTVQQFVDDCRTNPRFKAELAKQHVQLDDRELNPSKLARDLTYQQLAEAQLAAVSEHRGVKADITMGIGDVDAALMPGEKGEFEKPLPGSPQQRYVDEMTAKTRFLAAHARRAGAMSIELNNEPNLGHAGQPGSFWGVSKGDPTDIRNAARRYAYVAGSIYQALKTDPKTRGLAVNAASMGFTNSATPPFAPAGLLASDRHVSYDRANAMIADEVHRLCPTFVPGPGKDPSADADPKVRAAWAKALDGFGLGPNTITEARLASLLPGATAAQLTGFTNDYRNGCKLTLAGTPRDQYASQGLTDQMFNLYDQAQELHARKQGNTYVPVAHTNDGVFFLQSMHEAQQDFFGLRAHQPILSDQANLHFYGSPQADQEQMRAYGQLAADGVIPHSVVVTEFGSRNPNAKDQAADIYNQTANLLSMLKANGLKATQFETFCFDDYAGWGVKHNPHFSPASLTHAP